MRPLQRLAMLVAAHRFAIDVNHRSQRCHALAYSRIVSRKSDGRQKIYPLDDPGAPREKREGRRDVDGDGDGAANLRNEGSLRRRHPALTPLVRRVGSAFRSTFLPAAPPPGDILRSSGYLGYIIYDNVQDLSTSLRSVLATQRILEGVGVGRAGATALSATLNFIIRDGCGMIASLLFTSFASRSFRRNVKRWKFFADVMVDVGITLEIVAPSVLSYPLLSKWFLPLLCLGNICKALCGVAAGACGGALQMYWAVKVMGTEEGISEIAAKSGAQRTVMGGFGLVLAALVAKWLSSDVKTAIGIYCALTVVHLISNFKSLKLVALDWLNGWRLHLIAEEFLDCVSNGEGKISRNALDRPIVLSDPANASKKEPLLFLPEWRSFTSQSSKYSIRMGVSFNELAWLGHRSSLLQSDAMQKKNRRMDNYILAVGRDERSILVSFFSNITNVEKAKAYLHCCLVRRVLASELANGYGGCHPNDGDADMLIQTVESAAESELISLWPVFEQCASGAGWKLDKTECSTEGYEMFFE